SGICSRIAQGGRDSYFTTYRAEVVPELWFLTRKAQSRIFQAKTVPQILQKVFQGLQVTYQLKGHYEPPYASVHYHPTHFTLASTRMAEEGVVYFRKPPAGGHTMVVAAPPDAHPDVPFDPSATFAALDDTTVDEDRVTEWEKVQDLRSSKFLLWDHCFELPH